MSNYQGSHQVRSADFEVQRAEFQKPDGSPFKILVVDDESSLTDLLKMALRYEGWLVETAENGLEALALVKKFEPDALVLDIMMPEMDGMQVLSRMRAENNETPVLFLTAKDSVADRIKGLTAGGDDYVTKPFSLEEVVARLRALIRRSSKIGSGEESVLRVGDLSLDEDSYEVERAGTPIELTATEFELLRYLMRNQRKVLSKSQILDRVWSYDFGGKSSVVEIYISYLRKKIDSLGPAMIHTVRGVGYTIKVPSQDAHAAE
ncbi:MAG: response regulator transcription factor [Microbacteriaceae bacterium]